jgi:tetratricopeptide (TPR) repeat protein
MWGIRTAALWALAITCLAAPAFADPESENEALCAQFSDVQASIRGCTAIIQSDQEPGSHRIGAYQMRALMYQRTGRFDLAIEDFNNALAIALDENDIAIIYVNRGNAYTRSKQYDKALADYNSATHHDHGSGFAYVDRGRFYQFRNRIDLALSDYTKAISMQPTGFVFDLRGKAYSAKGLRKKAIADFSRAITHGELEMQRYKNKDYAVGVGEYYNDRAWERHLAKQDALALPDADQAVRLAPAKAECLETRAEIHERLGHRESAIADYLAAQKLDPEVKGAAEGLARLGASGR